MLKKILRFIRNYYLFVIALVALIISLILQFNHHALVAHWILSIVSIIEVIPLLWGMWDDLQTGHYGIDILAATAIVTAVIMKQYWAAIVIVIMLTGGEALEDYAENRAKTELNALLSKAPKQAHVVNKQQIIDVPISQVKVGDRLMIKPGELVPVDATIIEGSASFDESSLTGESLPQAKDVGDHILSGSINLDGAITVKALHVAADSQYEQIIKLVRAAAGSQAPFVRLADRYSVPFTVIAFIIAIGAWALSGQSIRFLEVLVVATPCPLILAAPIAVISGMSRAAKHGIIIKTGGALERLAEAETIAFDKTGTLTEGKLVVDTVKTFGSYRKDEVLALAAALEQNSTHILASAIVEAATKKKIKIPKAKHVQEESGRGLLSIVGGRQALVGRQAFLKDHDISFPTKRQDYEVKNTATFVAVDGMLAGIISFKDELRPESKRTLKALRSLGINHILMVTGDNQSTAQVIAKQLGISEVTAEALPSDKLRAIEEVKERPVAFVGDGVNDAPVLTASDIGIALGARGETAASESADMVIIVDDVSRVVRALSIAKRTFSVARQSILVGIALSIILMFIFSTGHFPPLYGAIIQEGVDIIVIFNALRAHMDGKDSATASIT
ncbi:MAG TPA: heavy metal translocating P-type ATPase [Candidatus Saccharimonadales bacterium]|nr:heavy metal translocating P-type ATPase [Candidatus Saccharimonadales bacterium]